MDTRKLEQEYERLIHDGMNGGSIQIRQDGPEMRDAPRFKLVECHIAVKVEPKFTIEDVSASGIAFISDLAFMPGCAMTLVLENTMGVQARVVGCEMIETEPAFLETRYRVQCRFESSNHGKQMLVMMKEMEKLPS